MCPPDLRSDASPFPPQVFYHLGELNDALNYALCAGSLFDVSETTDFVQTLLGTRANPQNVPARNRCSPSVIPLAPPNLGRLAGWNFCRATPPADKSFSKLTSHPCHSPPLAPR